MKTKTASTFQPVFRNLDWRLSSSANVRVDSGNQLSEVFHYHPQVELILLRNCRGNAIVGNKVCALADEAIFLIGKNTPHGFQYKHDRACHGAADAHAIVVQFDEHFLGRDFFSIPESYAIKRLLLAAQRGLAVADSKRNQVAGLMESMLDGRGFRNVLLLLEILDAVQEPQAHVQGINEPLAPSPGISFAEDARIQEVWDYTAKHFDRPIRIEEVAAQVNLTKESFCRYFKSKTTMTYMEYLFVYRIEKAKSMIIQNRLSIKEIGYASGFVSLSNFYYQFKKIMQCSPLEYQHKLFGQLKS